MPLLVHLAPEARAAAIGRSGIRLGSRNGYNLRGVYCTQLPNFFVSHQWLRELRRRGQRTFVAVDFRVPDDEPVLLGHYAKPHVEMSAVEAVRTIVRESDQLGYEMVLRRAVSAREIHRIRHVPHVVGWRYYPGSHGHPPCTCPVCLQPGEYGVASIRRRLSES